MQPANQNFPDAPVLILAPMGNDARNAADVLAKLNLRAEICRGMKELCQRAGAESGAFLISEEVVDEPSLAALVDFLIRQPTWSDIPIILLTKTGEIDRKTFNILNFLGTRANITLLEKPLRAITLISVVKAALRSRQHQFEVRKQLENYANALEGMQMATAKFWAVFDQSSVFCGIMALDGKLLETNQVSLRGCGYTAAEVIGRPFWECGWWRHSHEVREKIRRGTEQAAQGTPFLETLTYVWADGTERMVEFSIHPVCDEKGQIIFLQPAGIDVTERKRSEESLLASEQRYRTLFDSMIEGFCVIEMIFDEQQKPRDLFFLEVNPAFESQTGLTNAAGRRLLELVKDYDPFWFDMYGQVALNRKPVRFERLARSVNRWYEVFAAPVGPADSRRVAVVFNDISQRKQAEDHLRQSEERFRAMSDNIGQLAWIANAAGEMQWYNKRWYEYFGTTPETTLGKTTRHLHHPDYWPKVIAKYKQSIAEGTIWEDTFPLRGADGNYRWFLSRAFPIRDDTGKITLWFGTNTDITELREMQTALQEANSQLAGKAVELEALVEQRTAKLQETVGELEAFSYSIAHDMRSPLRSLQGFSDLLLVEYGNKFDEEGKRYLQRIGNAATRLDKLILDVLNYSRVVRGDLPLEAVDLEPLLHDIVETYPMLAPEKAEVQFASPLPVVLGNQAMLTQIFSNLMGNAVKFVAPGVKPRIKLWAETHESRVRVFVQDNGIGISRDQQPKIFGIFQQVDSQYEGTGIGLAVVKKAVERIGGQVQVQSELGKGSTFWIELKKA